MKCKFNKICNGYVKESFTCNHWDDPIGYCRLWKGQQAEKDEHGLLNKLMRIMI